MNVKNREKLLLIAAGSIILLLLADQVVFTPLIKLWKTRSDKIKELRIKYSDGQLLLQGEQKIRDSWMSMKTNALPANPAEAEGRMLRSVDRWTQASRINRTSFKQQWKQSAKDEDYMTLECQYDGSGTIQTIARFLFELEKDPMALRIDEFKVNARDDNGQQLALNVRFSGLKLNLDQK